MTDYAAGVPNSGPTLWMSDQFLGGSRASIATPPPLDSQWQSEKPGFPEIEALEWGDVVLGVFTRQARSGHETDERGALADPLPSTLADFFGQIVIRPVRIDAGFILSTVTFTFDVYNSYFVDRIFQTFTNNAGPGVTITDLPALPTTVLSQSGFTLTLQIEAEGPQINGTLVFAFDTETITVPVTGTRTAVFPFEPVEPIVERLLFLTDVLRSRTGPEQRVSVRLAPRQIIELALELEARERQKMESVVFSNQGLPFGLPVWWESTRLTSPIAPTDSTINVEETAFRDFRVGSNAIAFVDPFDFEVLEVLSLTATTITFTSPFQNPFAVAGTRIMPIRIAHVQRSVSGRKRPVRLQRNEMRWAVVDSNVDLGDVSAFPSFEGKVLLDEPNLIDGALDESLERPLTVVDSETGSFEVFTEQEVSRRTHAKGFLCNSMQRLWEVRQLLHGLRGRQASFFIPSFYDDFTPVASIASGGVTIDVENVGYTLFVQTRQPRDVVQVVKTDGTKATRRVVSAAELSDDVERITVDLSWGFDADPGEIRRVSFVEKVRLGKDEVEVEHFAQPGLARVAAPVVSDLG